MGLKRGAPSVGFVDVAALDNAARVAVKRYEDGLRLGAGGDDVSDLDLGPVGGGEPSDQARLPRKDFVEWSLRVLSPFCRPPVVLDCLRKLVKAASTEDLDLLTMATRRGLEEFSQLGKEAADLSQRDANYRPDVIPTTIETDGDGAWVRNRRGRTPRRASRRTILPRQAPRASGPTLSKIGQYNHSPRCPRPTPRPSRTRSGSSRSAPRCRCWRR